jgi:hypothetical protein
MQKFLPVLRAILITLVVLAAVAAGGYFVLPPRASVTKTFTVARPAQTVFTFLASAPAGARIAKGVTQLAITSAANNVVAADIAFEDGTKGTASYTISPHGEDTQVVLKMDHPLSASPIERIQALTGGNVKALVERAAVTITAQIGSIKTASFAGLRYSVVVLLAKPFFYIENCTSKESHDITAIINQAVQAIPPLLKANRLQQDGPLMAIEPHVVQGQYCYQVGYRYIGAKPNALLVGRFGDSPAGTALHMAYKGTEDKVVSEVYDRMDTLLAATHLDDPTRTDDDWMTFEVYNDDPTQPGGSRDRDIYYVVPSGVDLSRLTALVPPTATPAEAAAPTPETPARTPPPAAPAAPTSPETRAPAAPASAASSTATSS